MKLGELAQRLGCKLDGDGGIDIKGVGPIENAQAGEISFVANPRYRKYLSDTAAAAVIVGHSEANVPLPCLRADNPYLSFADAIDVFYTPPPSFIGIHPSAVIAPTARLGANPRVGPYCVIGEGCVLGDNARLDAHVVLYPEVRVGHDFRAFANVVVRERVVLGDRVILQCGAVIGGDGFGYVLGNDGSVRKITQAGHVVLEDDVEIGANTTIDRAAVGATILRRGVKIDNLVQIAHGCSIGEGSALAAQVGLSGSTRIGRFVRVGGQAGMAGHLNIGDGAQVGAQAGVPNDVAPGAIVSGYPAMDIHAFRRVSAAVLKLPELLRRVRRLEKKGEE